jgi:cytochrome c-type biogenesis protein CcmF
MFLGFLGFTLIASVVLLSLRIDTLVSEPSEDSIVAREGAFLLNNLLLVTVMFTVLVGTLFPIVAEALRGVKVSVGEPYFNRMAVPVFLALLLMMGVGPAMPWGRAAPGKLRRALLWPLPAGLVTLAVVFALGGRSWSVLLTGFLAGYALWVTADQGLRPARSRTARGEGLGTALRVSTARSPRRVGGYLVHFGVIMTFVAISVSSSYQASYEATLAPGEVMTAGAYELTFSNVVMEQQPHLVAQKASIQLGRGGRVLGELAPSINHYPTQREPLGTPAVRTSLTHDLYLTLMNVGGDGTVGLRAIVTPAVVWIWIGVTIMFFGTALCLVPARGATAGAAR